MNKKEEKKEQKISVSYTLKAFSNNIKKMHEAKLLTKEEEQELLKIHTTAVHRWIGLEFEVIQPETL